MFDWYRRWRAGRRPAALEPEVRHLRQDDLGWLLDYPLFIDDVAVEAFHDAILRPESNVVAWKATATFERAVQRQAKAEVGGKLTVSRMFGFLGIDPELSANSAFSQDVSTRQGGATEIQYEPIRNPLRSLVGLSLHFWSSLNERTVLVDFRLDQKAWASEDFAAKAPRAIAFVDFPPMTAFVPVAAEFGKGQVREIYRDIREAYEPDAADPEVERPTGDSDTSLNWDLYWAWYGRRVRQDPYKANRKLEEVVEKEGPIGWIDYRAIPPPNDGKHSYQQQIIHLHLVARGKYPTGTFAYNITQRGRKQGLRVVGGLRSGPSLNVLAVFEK